MSSEDAADALGDRAYRRRFRDEGNKREDWAVDVFREVFANLDDPGHEAFVGANGSPPCDADR